MASATGTIRHPKGPVETKTEQQAGPFLVAFFESSVGAKVLMALTGIGLAVFVLFHMIGNLKLFQGPSAINGYAYFLKHDIGILIWIARAFLLGIFILHIWLAVRLKLRSAAARPSAYQYPRALVQATLASRTMIWTGIVIGLFVVFHVAQFTFCFLTEAEVAPGKYVPYTNLRDQHDHQDVYSMVVAGFSSPWVSALYIVAQVALCLHLLHGIQSAFQTLGLKNRRFAPLIWLLGLAFAVTILVGNVGIVVAVQTGQVPPIYPR